MKFNTGIGILLLNLIFQICVGFNLKSGKELLSGEPDL